MTENCSAMDTYKKWKTIENAYLKEPSRNYDVELWDTKALWAGKGSSQNRPSVVQCITSPPLTSANVSITIMHPKPSWHAPLCRASCTYWSFPSRLHAGESHNDAKTKAMTWHFEFFKDPYYSEPCSSKNTPAKPFPSFCWAKLSPRPRRGGGGQR